jgi:hypothetical protein
VCALYLLVYIAESVSPTSVDREMVEGKARGGRAASGVIDVRWLLVLSAATFRHVLGVILNHET